MHRRKTVKSLSLSSAPSSPLSRYFDFGCSVLPAPSAPSTSISRRLIATAVGRSIHNSPRSPKLQRIMQLDDMVDLLTQTRTRPLRVALEASAKSQAGLLEELKKASRMDKEVRRRVLWGRIEAAKAKEEKMTEKEVKRVVKDMQRELKRFVFK